MLLVLCHVSRHQKATLSSTLQHSIVPNTYVTLNVQFYRKHEIRDIISKHCVNDIRDDIILKQCA